MGLRINIGGRESNSFISATDADSYIEQLGYDIDSWDDLSTAEKELRLEVAAGLMRNLPWRGRKVYEGQALSFPRTCQTVRHSIPDEIKRAQVDVAYSVVHRAMLSKPAVEDGAISGSRVSKVDLGGMLSVSFQKDAVESGNVIDRITRSVHFTTYALINKYLSQFRGGSIQNSSDISYSTTTTTTTTTTTSTTTTT